MNKDLVLETKPQFNFLVRFFSKNLGFAFAVAVIVSVMSFFFFAAANDFTESAHNLFKLICVYSFLLTLIFMLFIDKMNYLVTKYQIYNDKIYFEEGFINYKSKAVNLADIKEIHFTQSFLQRIVGLGTIKFLSPANISTDNYHDQSVEFKDIRDGQKIYNIIKAIYDLDNSPILETKPKYSLIVRVSDDLFLAFAPVLILPLGYLLFPLFGLLDSCFTRNVDFAQNLFLTGVDVAVPVLTAIYIISLLVYLFIRKKKYEVTSYKAFADHIEFDEGFINHKHRFIILDNVKEIRLWQYFLQRKAELGTVRFVSAGTGTIYDGISFSDIPNSLAVYTKVKQLHEG